jgi:hypothetical protein
LVPTPLILLGSNPTCIVRAVVLFVWAKKIFDSLDVRSNTAISASDNLKLLSPRMPPQNIDSSAIGGAR